jgi:hypothetical protein
MTNIKKVLANEANVKARIKEYGVFGKIASEATNVHLKKIKK